MEGQKEKDEKAPGRRGLSALAAALSAAFLTVWVTIPIVFFMFTQALLFVEVLSGILLVVSLTVVFIAREELSPSRRPQSALRARLAALFDDLLFVASLTALAILIGLVSNSINFAVLAAFALLGELIAAVVIYDIYVAIFKDLPLDSWLDECK